MIVIFIMKNLSRFSVENYIDFIFLTNLSIQVIFFKSNFALGLCFLININFPVKYSYCFLLKMLSSRAPTIVSFPNFVIIKVPRKNLIKAFNF